MWDHINESLSFQSKFRRFKMISTPKSTFLAVAFFLISNRSRKLGIQVFWLYFSHQLIFGRFHESFANIIFFLFKKESKLLKTIYLHSPTWAQAHYKEVKTYIWTDPIGGCPIQWSPNVIAELITWEPSHPLTAFSKAKLTEHKSWKSP